MASLFFYTKSSEMRIFDLEYFDNNKLNLQKIKAKLEERKAEVNQSKEFDKEGYVQINLDEDKSILSSSYIFENNLGEYSRVLYDEDSNNLTVSRNKYLYFGQARLIITSNLDVIFISNYSSEEGVKSKCISFLDDLGLEIIPVKYDNKVFKHIRDKYDWRRINIQKIEKENDSTKSVSYEVDSSSDKKSQVDELYKDSGIFDNIVFNVEFEDQVYTVKLYKKNHKISVSESQFESKQKMEEFSLYLLGLILDIKNKAPETKYDEVKESEENED